MVSAEQIDEALEVLEEVLSACSKNDWHLVWGNALDEQR